MIKLGIDNIKEQIMNLEIWSKGSWSHSCVLGSTQSGLKIKIDFFDNGNMHIVI